MKRAGLALLGTLVALASGPPLRAEDAPTKIDRLMTSYADAGRFNGTILVRQRGRTLYEKAFGLADRSWHQPNTVDSKFLIGSVSKSATALMVLILVNEGRIDLDANINTYIPRYEGPGKNRATIHQMLTHTSGIPNHGAIPDLSKKRVRWMYDSDAYVALVKETAPKFEPGEGFEYSGIAYNLLAIACEKVTGQGFGELLKRRIFVPLGMKDSSLNGNLDLDAKRAYGYEYHLLEGYRLPSYISMDHCKGSGGILSTVEDLARFNAECFDAQTLTSKALYARMLTPHVKDWQQYGYGWWIDTVDVNGAKKTLISHGGSTDGYKAYSTRVVEDGVDVILLENDYFRTDVGVKWTLDITNEVIDILAGKDVPDSKRSIARAVGLAIGQEGIEKALARLAELKKDRRYGIDARDYRVLADELEKKHDRKPEAIRILDAGVADFPDDFPLNFRLAEALKTIDSVRARGLYERCVRLCKEGDRNGKYAEECRKAVEALSASGGAKGCTGRGAAASR